MHKRFRLVGEAKLISSVKPNGAFKSGRTGLGYLLNYSHTETYRTTLFVVTSVTAVQVFRKKCHFKAIHSLEAVHLYQEYIYIHI